MCMRDRGEQHTRGLHACLGAIHSDYYTDGEFKGAVNPAVIGAKFSGPQCGRSPERAGDGRRAERAQGGAQEPRSPGGSRADIVVGVPYSAG